MPRMPRPGMVSASGKCCTLRKMLVFGTAENRSVGPRVERDEQQDRRDDAEQQPRHDAERQRRDEREHQQDAFGDLHLEQVADLTSVDQPQRARRSGSPRASPAADSETAA